MTTKPLTRLSAADLERLELPERETILDPILDSKTIALLYGPRGLGNTFVALGIAWAAASGKSFLGWRARRPPWCRRSPATWSARSTPTRRFASASSPRKIPRIRWRRH